MGASTNIEWTDATWNPIRGCSRVSKGCEHCYAERVAHRFSGAGQPYEGLTHLVNGHPAWTGNVTLAEKHLLDPLKWGSVRLNGEEELVAGAMRRVYGERQRRIFVNSMSDLFHPNVPDEWIDRIFAVMALCPQHTFQILTKRPERMLEYFLPKKYQQGNGRNQMRLYHISRVVEEIFPGRTSVLDQLFEGGPLPNVHLGVSVEDQKTADERIPLLLQTPAALRFISAEPLLGPINLHSPGMRDELGWLNDGPDWVIVGGESGPGARPMHPVWARSLRDQCLAAGVPFFFKQWGEWIKCIDRDVEDPDWRQDYSRTKRTDRFRILNLAGGYGFHGERVHLMERVGKKAAGSLLDGREWKEFPV